MMDSATLFQLAMTAHHIKNTISSVGKNPIITNDDDNDDIEAQKKTVKGGDTDSLIEGGGKCHYLSIHAVVLVSIVMGLMSTILVSNGLVDVSSLLLCLIIGPAVIVQRCKLLRLGTFRTQHNKLRENANRLSVENQKLSNNINALEIEVRELDSVNTKLDEITQKTGQSIDALTSLIETNATIQKEMMQTLQDQVLHQLVSMSLTSDSDQDMMIDPNEVDILIMRLSTIRGVTFDETKFRNYLSSRNNILSYTDFLAIANDIQNNITIDSMTSQGSLPDSDMNFFIFEPIQLLNDNK